MSAERDPEQAELQHELLSHSDRFLDKTAELSALEVASRETPIGTPEFQDLSAAVAKAAGQLQNIATAQDEIGKEADTTDVAIEDVRSENPER